MSSTVVMPAELNLADSTRTEGDVWNLHVVYTIKLKVSVLLCEVRSDMFNLLVEELANY